MDRLMGAPGLGFPAKFSGFRALYAPFRIERRTRGPVQYYVQENSGGLAFEAWDPSRKCRQKKLESSDFAGVIAGSEAAARFPLATHSLISYAYCGV